MADSQQQWPGLVTDADPHDTLGARVQDNCMSLVPGILQGRGGIREVWFENATARVGGNVADITTLPNILAVGLLRRAEGDYIVFVDSSGNVMSGRGPA